MTNPKVELKLELTQVEGFGVGIFLRSVILERWVIPTTYRPKGQVDGRGGEIWTPDILLPKQARYRTALHPEYKIKIRFLSNIM